VLGTTLEQLREEGLAEELYQLRQLQCVYVGNGALLFGPLAVAGEMVARRLHVLSKCSSLRAVLCWGAGDDDGAQGASPETHPLRQYVQEGQVHLSSWHKWRDVAVEGRVVCPRPCPHLPCVWELQ
jgi:hypothetical protein